MSTRSAPKSSRQNGKTNGHHAPTSEGVTPESLEAAKRLILAALNGRLPSGDLAVMTSSNYNPGMITKERPKPTTRPDAIDTKMARGDEWYAKVARGLSRWRMKKGLSIPKASVEYGIALQSWYRIERAVNERAAARHFDTIVEITGLSHSELMKLGEEP